jgi:hypothetical protein
MSDSPILFSAEMVRAILDGRKTQTRRVMKVQPWPDATVEVGPYHPHWIDRNGESQPGPSTFGAVWDHQDIVNGGDTGLRCPYGAPGDLLWVREGFAVQPELWADNHGPQPIHYTADQVIGFAGKPDQRQIEDYRSKPSIHMPRWASRITLRITDIRVERLQDITEDDARAEGCDPARWIDETDVGMEGYREGFARLWNKINGPGAWDANPWIWAVSFERVTP